MNKIEKQDYTQYFLIQRDPVLFGFVINPFGQFKRIVHFGIMEAGQETITKAKYVTIFETEDELRQKVNSIKRNKNYYDIYVGNIEDPEENE